VLKTEFYKLNVEDGSQESSYKTRADAMEIRVSNYSFCALLCTAWPFDSSFPPLNTLSFFSVKYNRDAALAIRLVTFHIQDVSGGIVNILGGGSVD
jgi:hypothetical protein